MRIGEHRSTLILFGLSSALFAQNLSGVPDVQRIVESSTAATQRHWGLRWIKVDAQVIQPVSMGFFLARVLRGSHITVEQARVDKGMWMPKHVEVRAAAKIFFVKSLVIERVLTYSEYRLPLAAAPAENPASP